MRRAIKPHVVRRAIGTLAPRATDVGSGDSGSGDLYTPAQIALNVEPGDRTRLGKTAFRVSTSEELEESARGRLVRLLQSSIEFEAPGSVTPYEETDREIANLKDTIGTNLREGAYGTAQRALELLGQIARGVWKRHIRKAWSLRGDFRSLGVTGCSAALARPNRMSCSRDVQLEYSSVKR